jgi:acyl-CoA synthetase (AMP-forming)/AMP-acid ligase II
MAADFSVPDDGAPYNAGEALLEAAARRGARRLIRCEGQDFLGGELAAFALALQRALGERGLVAGDRVLLLLRDTPAFLAVFLGALRGGFVPVPISTLLPPKDVAFIARDAGVRAAFVDSALPLALADAALYPPGPRSSTRTASASSARPRAGPRSPRRRRARPIPRSSCTRPEPPASRRASCTDTSICRSRRGRTRATCWVSPRATACSPPRSSSSPTGSGTR